MAIIWKLFNPLKHEIFIVSLSISLEKSHMTVKL